MKNLWKFDNGIYPVIPGISMDLGDYGYWKDGQWCRLGNIEKLPGSPRFFSTKQDELNQKVSASIAVEIKTEAGVTLDTPEAKAGASIRFKNKNSQLFIGNLNSCVYYSSINMEIFPFLQKLQEDGLWKSEYWLAYYIALSDNFVSMRSKAAGVDVRLESDLSMETLNQSKAGINAMISRNQKGISAVSNIGSSLKFAGAKFISIQKSGWLKREVKVKFNSANDNEVILD